MSFALYLIGFLVLVGTLAWVLSVAGFAIVSRAFAVYLTGFLLCLAAVVGALVLADLPPRYIAVAAVIVVGLGVTIVSTRSRHPQRPRLR